LISGFTGDFVFINHIFARVEHILGMRMRDIAKRRG